jgi:8-oxo-dGTP pyrophosphatase MutT (NUDIX family)
VAGVLGSRTLRRIAEDTTRVLTLPFTHQSTTLPALATNPHEQSGLTRDPLPSRPRAEECDNVDAMEEGLRTSTIAAALRDHEPRVDPGVPAIRKAAVAAILRDARPGAELLFIHRAEDPRDPWSGHMAFPGGHIDPSDGGPLGAALRETREELGLDLEGAGILLGRLSEVRTHLRAGRVPHSVTPFVFELRGEVGFTLSAEVQDVLWVPLAFLAEGRNRRTFAWVRRGVPVPMPCYRWAGRTIWGLTLRIVDELLTVARASSV